MKRMWRMLWMMGGLMAAVASRATSGPAEWVFCNPQAKATWQAGLPPDCQAVSPTCVYSVQTQSVYLLAEMTGLGEGYEVEFLLLGALSDRAYEGLAIAWDLPSTVGRAVERLGVPRGKPADFLRGMPMAQGERFTMSIKVLSGEAPAFRPLADLVVDDYSTPAQALFARGFPFVGEVADDTVMPCSLVSAYTDLRALFGMPYAAPKGQAYGAFRAKVDMAPGTPAVVALHWERLAQPRVFHEEVTVTAEMLSDPTALLEKLRTFCEDPRDIFLQVAFAPELEVAACVPFARLLVALEEQGGFVLEPPAEGQMPVRALLPDAAWNDREKRVFQPWEVELTPKAEGGVEATLCQILEDWTVDGIDPALTRKCYPGVTPATIDSVMGQVDESDGRVYVVFFYVAPGTKVGDVAPYASALTTRCPTQWIFCTPPATP